MDFIAVIRKNKTEKKNHWTIERSCSNKPGTKMKTRITHWQNRLTQPVFPETIKRHCFPGLEIHHSDRPDITVIWGCGLNLRTNTFFYIHSVIQVLLQIFAIVYNAFQKPWFKLNFNLVFVQFLPYFLKIVPYWKYLCDTWLIRFLRFIKLFQII